MIGDMLADKPFVATIPRRIAARMNAIREMSNLGPHGEAVDRADAVRVIRDLLDVLEWYVVQRDPIGRTVMGHEDRQSLEILPQLREKYPRYLRPEIISVKFVQSPNRCHLEITTVDDSRDVVDEVSRFVCYSPANFFTCQTSWLGSNAQCQHLCLECVGGIPGRSRRFAKFNQSPPDTTPLAIYDIRHRIWAIRRMS